MVPYQVQGGRIPHSGARPGDSRKLGTLVQWYRRWADTEISLSAKNLVWRHGSVNNTPGSTLKDLEFGGCSLFAARGRGITEPVVNVQDLQPTQSTGLAPRVTPELARPSPAVPKSGTWGIPVSPPCHLLQPWLFLSFPMKDAGLIARTAPGGGLTSPGEATGAQHRLSPLSSPLPGTARMTRSPGITSRE